MADYWKSQTRKYCEFCKCWIADNKPTIQYHENGKRHKENVAKKISEMAKKSAKQHKEKTKLDNEMKKMEEEAMRAYMKDVESNADFTSRLLKEKLKKEKDEQDQDEEEEEEEDDDEELEGDRKECISMERKECISMERKECISMESKVVEDEKSNKKEKIWYEGKSEEGHTYYWNIHSSESRWEKPKDGYVSLAEQKRIAEQKDKKEAAAVRAKSIKDEDERKEKNEELRAFKAREAMKRFRKVEENEEKDLNEISSCGSALVGPAPRVDPYGAWTRVEPVIEKKVDLQLPKPAHPVPFPVTETYEPQVVIKEKKLSGSLVLEGDEGEMVGFKKRKLTGGRANIRQRTSELDDS